MSFAVKTRLAIKIPEGGEVLVKKGKKIEKDEVLIKFGKKNIRLVDASRLFSKISQAKLEEWKVMMVGKEVNIGDVILKIGKMIPKVLKAPINGKITGIDDFFNIVIEEGNELVREIKSPVKSIVKRVKDNKIVLEFKAKKIMGQMIKGNRSWGELGESMINKISDLGSGFRDKILLTNIDDDSLVNKAEALGVSGILYFGDRIWNLNDKESPAVLKIDAETADFLLKKCCGNRALINGDKGKLLVVVE